MATYNPQRPSSKLLHTRVGLDNKELLFHDVSWRTSNMLTSALPQSPFAVRVAQKASCSTELFGDEKMCSAFTFIPFTRDPLTRQEWFSTGFSRLCAILSLFVCDIAEETQKWKRRNSRIHWNWRDAHGMQFAQCSAMSSRGICSIWFQAKYIQMFWRCPPVSNDMIQ